MNESKLGRPGRKVKRVRGGTLRKVKIPQIRYQHVIDCLTKNHSFISNRFVSLKEGYIKCPFCGGRSKRFIEIIREDGFKLKVGWKCVGHAGLVIHQYDRDKQEEYGEKDRCYNTDEFAQIMSKVKKELGLQGTLVAVRDKQRQLTNSDLTSLLE